MDLKEEEILGGNAGSHWYYKAKAAALLADLRGHRPQKILDIGAGSGFFSRMLLERTAASEATCVDIGYAEDHDQLHCGKTLSFRRSVSASDADLVLAMDVLEHVSDERKLLRPYLDAVTPGTRFIISVPAFQSLWSSHDVYLQHLRRYTLKGLASTVADCGIELDWIHYYYGAVFPLAAAMRLAERLRGRIPEPKSHLSRQGALPNAVLSVMCAGERPLMSRNKFFGLTILAGGRKPDADQTTP